MTGDISLIVNNALQFIQTTGAQVVEGFKTLYEAQGISEVLRQNYKVFLGTGYVAWLLHSINHKEITPGKEAEDAALIIKCKEEYGREE